MQLVEQGKLDLDADVNTYLKQFKIPATYPEPITLRHVLTHTVGLEDGGIGYLMAREREQIVPLGRSLAQHKPARVRPARHERATALSSSYSNWATALAGLIVANVSGVSFEDYVEQQHPAAPGHGAAARSRSRFRSALAEAHVGRLHASKRARSSRRATSSSRTSVPPARWPPPPPTWPAS